MEAPSRRLRQETKFWSARIRVMTARCPVSNGYWAAPTPDQINAGAPEQAWARCRPVAAADVRNY